MYKKINSLSFRYLLILCLAIYSCSNSGLSGANDKNNKNNDKNTNEDTTEVDTGIHGPESGMHWMVNLPAKGRYKKTVEQVLADNECLNGIFIRTNWEQIESTEGEYDWSQIDWAVKQAQEHDLQYKIMLLPGMHTPQWVYDKGAEVFQSTIPWELRPDYGQPAKIPLPWDKTYQRYYKRMMKKLARRYGDDKHFVSITLTGANFVYGEMHLPKSNSDIQKWQQYDNYQKRIEKFYKNITDFYGTTFPHQQFDLHITIPIDGMQNNVKNIINYGTREYPNRFTLQNAQLRGNLSNQNIFSYKMIYQNKVGTHTGFQSLNSFVKFRSRAGSPEIATLNFVNADGEYWELLKPDGKSAEFTCRLTNLVDSAREMGAAQFRRELKENGQLDDDFGEKRDQMQQYINQHRYNKALEILDETFRFIEADISLKIDLLQKANRTDDAIMFLKDTVLAKRNTAAFHEMLANVYTSDGSYDKAGSNLETAYQLSSNSDYLFKEGNLYADYGMKAEAIGAFNNYIKVEGYSKASYQRVADLYDSHGFDNALEGLKEDAADHDYNI